MTTALTTTNQQPVSPWTGLPIPAVDPQAVEQALMIGDLAKMPNDVRIAYYLAVCQSAGLNPLTRPFTGLADDKGHVFLYANKDCTEQLRKRDRVSLTIVSRETVGDILVVTARATLPCGRTDEAQGVVPIVKQLGTFEEAKSGKRYFKPLLDAHGEPRYVPLRGLDLANAIKKAESQSKRRVTLSICGLGFSGFDEQTPGNAEVRLDLTTGMLQGHEGPPQLEARPVDAEQAQRNVVDLFDRDTGEVRTVEVRPSINNQGRLTELEMRGEQGEILGGAEEGADESPEQEPTF